MSSPESSLRRAAVLGLALAPLLLVAGCFRPMYASLETGGPSLGSALSSVQIARIDGRAGQQVRNNLAFAFTGGADPEAPKYTLKVTVSSSRNSSIVDAQTNEPEVDTVMLVSAFELYPYGAPTPVLVGKSYSRKSFDRTLERFAALRAARDAEDEAAGLLAEQIKTRVAVYLTDHP